MSTLIRNVRIIDIASQIDVVDDVFISPDQIEISPNSIPNRALILNGNGCILSPGLVDLHVHFREPGFTHKEDIISGIRAALAGGVTSALVMPNTYPAIDSFSGVCYQHNRADRLGFDLLVAGCATRGLGGQKLTDVAELKRAGVRAITDDGKALADDDLTADLLKKCRLHDVVFMQHAEDMKISCGHSLNEGAVSKTVGLLGQPVCAESSMVERDIALAQKIGARYHVLHLSSKDSLDLVRKAKLSKARISCEVAPHHLLLDERAVIGLDAFKKMNPPLRTKSDRFSLIEGINDGIVDAVASDHAPHSSREKRQPFELAPFGVVGVETSILALLTLVKQGTIALKKAIELMTLGPARVLGEQDRIGTMFGPGALKNAVLLDPEHSFVMSTRNLYGRSKNSAFLGLSMYGRVKATFLEGQLAFSARS